MMDVLEVLLNLYDMVYITIILFFAIPDRNKKK